MPTAKSDAIWRINKSYRIQQLRQIIPSHDNQLNCTKLRTLRCTALYVRYLEDLLRVLLERKYEITGTFHNIKQYQFAFALEFEDYGFKTVRFEDGKICSDMCIPHSIMPSNENLMPHKFTINEAYDSDMSRFIDTAIDQLFTDETHHKISKLDPYEDVFDFDSVDANDFPKKTFQEDYIMGARDMQPIKSEPKSPLTQLTNAPYRNDCSFQNNQNFYFAEQSFKIKQDIWGANDIYSRESDYPPFRSISPTNMMGYNPPLSPNQQSFLYASPTRNNTNVLCKPITSPFRSNLSFYDIYDETSSLFTELSPIPQ